MIREMPLFKKGGNVGKHIRPKGEYVDKFLIIMIAHNEYGNKSINTESVISTFYFNASVDKLVKSLDLDSRVVWVRIPLGVQSGSTSTKIISKWRSMTTFLINGIPNAIHNVD